MVVSPGVREALLVTQDTSEHILVPTVFPKSTIGAGDNMLVGMLLGLAEEKTYSEMTKYRVACGTAAIMSPGTQLCKKKEVDQLYEWILNN